MPVFQPVTVIRRGVWPVVTAGSFDLDDTAALLPEESPFRRKIFRQDDTLRAEVEPVVADAAILSMGFVAVDEKVTSGRFAFNDC